VDGEKKVPPNYFPVNFPGEGGGACLIYSDVRLSLPGEDLNTFLLREIPFTSFVAGKRKKS